MKYILLLSIIFISSCSKEGNPIPDVTTGLVVKIDLDGDAIESVSQTTGTIYGAIPTTNHLGEAGKAMMFNAADSAYIDFGDLAGASFTDNIFTISCWVYVTDTSSKICAVSKRNGSSQFEYSLDTHFDNTAFTLDNWVQNGGATVYGVDPLKAEAAIELNTWHQVTYVADGSLLIVYVDGEMINGSRDSIQTGRQFTNTDAPFVIGNGGAYNKNHYFNGAIDNVRMYNRALNAEEVTYLMQY
jgi:hypothetical protein